MSHVKTGEQRVAQSQSRAAQAIRSADLRARQKVCRAACLMQRGQRWEGKVAKELK